MAATAPNPRILQLDVIRALAIFLVLGRHLPRPIGGTDPWLLAFDTYWRRCGWVGVDLFFVLSGFLVSGLLFREYQKRRTLDVGRFLIRRGFKIYPAFYVMLGFTLVFFSQWLLTGKKEPDAWWWQKTIGDALFVQNYYDAWWPHTWSLAVEEHFYIFIAVLLWRMSASGRGTTPTADDAPASDPFAALPRFFYAVAAICLVMRVRNAIHHPYSHFTHIFPTHLRADSLFFGVYLSYLFHFHRERLTSFVNRTYYGLLVIGLALVAPSLYFEVNARFMHTIGLTFLYVGFGALLLVTLHTDRFPRGPGTRALAWVGFHSYSIYLWHTIARHWVGENLALVWREQLGVPMPHAVKIVLYVAGSIVVGVIAAKVVEVPALKVRDKFFPSRDKAPGAASTPALKAPELAVAN